MPRVYQTSLISDNFWLSRRTEFITLKKKKKKYNFKDKSVQIYKQEQPTQK